MFLRQRVYRFARQSIKTPIFSQCPGQTTIDMNHLQKQQGQGIDALVIVNNILNQQWLGKGLKQCSHVVIADGGANKMYATRFRDNPKIKYIVGDMDSIKPYVRQFYESRGVVLEHVADQNTNDFQKAVTKAVQNKWTKIMCFGAFGGRMDHSLAGMSNTAKLSTKHPQLQLALFGRENIMYFVRAGVNTTITISKQIQKTGCGLMRFGNKINVQTKGLRWNLGPKEQFSYLEWGNLVSTSNQIIGDTVEILAEGDIFFVVHIKDKSDDFV